MHFILKTGTSDSRKAWFAVGDYKRYENEVGGKETTKPENVAKEIKQLLKKYNEIKEKTLEEIIGFHYEFEKIHPFQDDNGRVGRLIMFKECLFVCTHNEEVNNTKEKNAYKESYYSIYAFDWEKN